MPNYVIYLTLVSGLVPDFTGATELTPADMPPRQFFDLSPFCYKNRTLYIRTTDASPLHTLIFIYTYSIFHTRLSLSKPFFSLV